MGMNEHDTTRLELDSLREQLANLIELLNHLETVEGPNLRNAYMLAIGRLEFQAFELDMECRKWRRRLQLRQTALNRGERPDPAAIERLLDKEMAEYARRLEEWRHDCHAAYASTQMGYMPSAEMANLRGLYLDAVKRLHPDLNPDMPPQAADLWNRLQKAYKEGRVLDVKFLATLVDDVVGARKTFPCTAEGLAAMRTERERLRSQMRAVEQEIEKMKREKPLAYRLVLEDKKLVARRQDELKVQIEGLARQIKTFEAEWRAAHGK